MEKVRVNLCIIDRDSDSTTIRVCVVDEKTTSEDVTNFLNEAVEETGYRKFYITSSYDENFDGTLSEEIYNTFMELEVDFENY